MPKVEAWMCPKTNKLFPDIESYCVHLKKLARKQLEKRKADRIEREFDRIVERFWSTAQTFDDIATFLENNGDLIYARTSDFNKTVGSKKRRPPRMTDVRFVNMTWDDQCSNSHSAPKGKPTNWEHTEDLPKGYPGWTGRIEFILGPMERVDTDVLEMLGVHTGSGGGGAGRYRYSVTIFADEFVGMGFVRMLMRPPKEG